MLNELQKRAAQAIVNIFETGSPRGDYARVTLIDGDSGHLTYGRAQTTLGSGNLYLLVKRYVEAPGAEYAADLVPYLGRLEARDTHLDLDATLKRTLRDAGRDPVMIAAQDAFFDSVYWQPALASAGAISLAEPTSIAVVYDSRIHGSWHAMRDRTNERKGSVADVGKRQWVRNYVQVRRDWLANHPNAALHPTVYRMDAFRALFRSRNWTLKLPFSCRGIRIDEHALSAQTNPRAEPLAGEPRVLRLRSPYTSGQDVEAVQQALVDAGFPTDVDGVFGPATAAAVRAFQRSAGITVDALVGPGTRAALGID